MVLNVIDRPGNAYQAFKHLLRDNHEDRAKQRKHIHHAIEIYRALLAGGVVERLDEPDEKGRYVRLTVDLQYDFALNQPLSPFALAAIEPARQGERELRPRRAVGHRVHPRQPPADPVRPAVPRPGRGRRRDEGRRHRVRGADGAARRRHLAQAAGGRPRGRLRDLPAGPPVGRRLRGLPQGRRPRPVRAGDDVRRVRPVLQPVPVGRDRAALPGRRLQGTAADRPRRGQDRGAHRPDRVARRAHPPGRLLAGRRVGEAHQPRPGVAAELQRRSRRR